MEKKQVRVGVAVYIIKGNQVLLGKRKGAHAQNQWATPGGHLEFTETWVGCAYREVEEEVGIKVDNIRFGFATNDIFVEDNKHYVTIDMVADYISGEVQLLEPEKCEKWQWFSWDDLPSPLIVTTENAIKRGFNPFAV